MRKALLIQNLSPTASFSGKAISRWTRSSSALKQLLIMVETGKITSAQAEEQIRSNYYNGPSSKPTDEALTSFANLDHTRASRTGFPEAVFAESKTATQVAAILDDMAKHVNQRLLDPSITTTSSPISTAILATRVTPEQYEQIQLIPLKHGTIEYHSVARIISMKASAISEISQQIDSQTNKKVVVACAGTTDLPVAEEASITLESAGCQVIRVYDAGVAGLHRILNALPKLRDPQVGCVIVCAGMDGALPSVVGGLVQVPVIAVPTSIGYGASFGGVSALLTMLNSCAPGVGVVNIDNGFGAAALAFKCIVGK